MEWGRIYTRTKGEKLQVLDMKRRGHPTTGDDRHWILQLLVLKCMNVSSHKVKNWEKFTGVRENFDIFSTHEVHTNLILHVQRGISPGTKEDRVAR